MPFGLLDIELLTAADVVTAVLEKQRFFLPKFKTWALPKKGDMPSSTELLIFFWLKCIPTLGVQSMDSVTQGKK